MRVFVDTRRFLGFLKQFLRLFYRQFAHWGISELHLVELHREFHLGGSLFQNWVKFVFREHWFVDDVQILPPLVKFKKVVVNFL